MANKFIYSEYYNKGECDNVKYELVFYYFNGSPDITTEFLPRGCLTIGKSKSQYDKQPLGLPTSPNFKITFDLSMLSDDFKNKLFNPICYTSSNNVQFGLTVALYFNGDLEYIGTLKQSFNLDYSIDDDTLDLDFYDIVKVALDQYPINDIIDSLSSEYVQKDAIYFNLKNNGVYAFRYYRDFNYLYWIEFQKIIKALINYTANYVNISTIFDIFEMPLYQLNITGTSYYYCQNFDNAIMGNVCRLFSDDANETKVMVLAKSVNANTGLDSGGFLYKLNTSFKDSYEDHKEALGNYTSAFDFLNEWAQSEYFISYFGFSKTVNQKYLLTYNCDSQITNANNLTFNKLSFITAPKLSLKNNILGECSVALKEVIGYDTPDYKASKSNSKNSGGRSIPNVFKIEIPLIEESEQDNITIHGVKHKVINYKDLPYLCYYYINETDGIAQPVALYWNRSQFNGKNIFTKFDTGDSEKLHFNDYKFIASQIVDLNNKSKSQTIANEYLALYSNENQWGLKCTLPLKDSATEKKFPKLPTKATFNLATEYGKSFLSGLSDNLVLVSYEIDYNNETVDCEFISYEAV